MSDDRPEGMFEKLKGRFKKSAGDIAGDEKLKREGARDEKLGEAKDDLGKAQDEVEEKAKEVQRRDES